MDNQLFVCEIFACKLSPRACALRWARGLEVCSTCEDGRLRAEAEGVVRDEKKGRKHAW